MVDASVASSVAWRTAVRYGADRRAAIEIAIVVRELATNIVKHGGGRGIITIGPWEEGIEVIATDEGSGVEDHEGFIRDGHSRGQMIGPMTPKRDGLGIGGGSIVRLMDSLVIEEAHPKGAKIIVRKRLGKCG